MLPMHAALQISPQYQSHSKHTCLNTATLQSSYFSPFRGEEGLDNSRLANTCLNTAKVKRLL